MSSFIGGTNNGYESISDYRLYLDLSLTDKEFNTNLYTPSYFTEMSNNVNMYNTYPTLGNFSNPVNTVYTELYKNNNKFIELIDGIFPDLAKKHLNGNVDNQITAFIPVNGIEGLNDVFKSGNYRVENILKYHIIDYYILPVQLFNKINKIYTKYDNQYIIIGGTNNELFILNRENSKYKNKILKTLKVDNGIIYFIDKPLIPYLY
jgi:uncharacterized surface protein with fasciclin (FAS1) repeats